MYVISNNIIGPEVFGPEEQPCRPVILAFRPGPEVYEPEVCGPECPYTILRR